MPVIPQFRLAAWVSHMWAEVEEAHQARVG